MTTAGFGVYIHIPYCLSRCHYCDFNVQVLPEPPWPRFFAALASQWRLQAPRLFAAQPVRSIYFGGGTPSLAPAADIAACVEMIQRHGVMHDGDIEITLEANPDTVTATYLADLRHAGINRISFGWQSTSNRLLQTLGRRHDAQKSLDAYALCRKVGFGNISIDLIFAVPGQTLQDLNADLDAIVALQPEHVSLYGLTYHQGTKFDALRRKGALRPVPETLEVVMMQRIEEVLEAAGYEHYEISNYAKPGLQAVHNGAYWRGVPYLGLGPGAHSFVRHSWEQGWRWEGVRRPEAYMQAWEQPLESPGDFGIPTSEHASVSWVEQLTARQLLNEFIMCGLRCRQGVEPMSAPIAPFYDELLPKAQSASERGWLDVQSACWQPSSNGYLHSDSLAEWMMLD